MDYNKYEDAIMKMVHEYFGTAILPFLGIQDTIVGRGPTEIADISITKMYMDFTFLTASGSYLHIEFQTTDNGIHDLQRFHVYEAWLRYQTNKEVFTYVIYTGGIKSAVFEDCYGINTYRVKPIFMAARDADRILRELKEKVTQGTPLDDNDLVRLALTPVMGSQYPYKERIMTAVNILKSDNGEKTNQVMAVLYAFAEKFVKNPVDLNQLKGVMLMTRLGQMLFDDGFEKGIEQGREELRRVNDLHAKLLDDNRVEDLKRALSDSDYQKQLMNEYQL